MNKRTRDISPSKEVEDATHQTKKIREEKNKLAQIFDGTYFEVVEHDKNTKNISARCMKCGIKEKIIRGQSTSTGNFYQHILRTHPDEYMAMKDKFNEIAEKKLTKKTVPLKTQSILSFAGLLDAKKVSLFNRELFFHVGSIGSF